MCFELCWSPFHTRSLLQSVCLKPFAIIRGPKEVSIVGNLDPAFCEWLRDQMTSCFKSTDPVLEFTRKCLGMGDAAQFQGAFSNAIRQYQFGTAFLINMAFSFPDMSPNDERILNIMAGTLKCHSARSMLNLGLFEEVLNVGSWLLHLNNLPELERVIMTLCLAHAHDARGEKKKADDMFEEALHLPVDKAMVLQESINLFPTVQDERRDWLQEDMDVFKNLQAVQECLNQGEWNETVEEFLNLRRRYIISPFRKKYGNCIQDKAGGQDRDQDKGQYRGEAEVENRASEGPEIHEEGEAE